MNESADAKLIARAIEKGFREVAEAVRSLRKHEFVFPIESEGKPEQIDARRPAADASEKTGGGKNRGKSKKN